MLKAIEGFKFSLSLGDLCVSPEEERAGLGVALGLGRERANSSVRERAGSMLDAMRSAEPAVEPGGNDWSGLAPVVKLSLRVSEPMSSPGEGIPELNPEPVTPTPPFRPDIDAAALPPGSPGAARRSGKERSGAKERSTKEGRGKTPKKKRSKGHQRVRSIGDDPAGGGVRCRIYREAQLF